MDRTQWLQDRRMQKFRDVLSRWERRELSAMEAGEVLGVSERQFRRYRQRYEEEGLSGLLDRRPRPQPNGYRWTRSNGCSINTGPSTAAGT